jgi:hypothetical protein
MTTSRNDKVFQLQSEVRRQLEVNRLVYKCEDCVEHELDYKKLDDVNNQERDERMQKDIKQSNRIIDLEHQIQLLKDEMAYGAMEGSVAGFGDDLNAEEQAYQQAKQQHSS